MVMGKQFETSRRHWTSSRSQELQASKRPKHVDSFVIGVRYIISTSRAVGAHGCFKTGIELRTTRSSSVFGTGSEKPAPSYQFLGSDPKDQPIRKRHIRDSIHQEAVAASQE
jgi:hypothetical protein